MIRDSHGKTGALLFSHLSFHSRSKSMIFSEYSFETMLILNMLISNLKKYFF